MKLLIRGHTWTVHLFSSKKFIGKFGDHVAALAAPKERMFFFNSEDIDLETVAHEIMHAFFAEGSTTAVGLTPEQTEEAACEVFGIYGPEMLAMARKVRRHLVKSAKAL